MLYTCIYAHEERSVCFTNLVLVAKVLKIFTTSFLN